MEFLRSALSRAGGKAKAKRACDDPADPSNQQPSSAKRNESSSPFHRKSASADLAALFNGNLDIPSSAAFKGGKQLPNRWRDKLWCANMIAFSCAKDTSENRRCFSIKNPYRCSQAAQGY
jgi:hypothetical protein